MKRIPGKKEKKKKKRIVPMLADTRMNHTVSLPAGYCLN
jgi:hypothetical protein